MLASHRAGRSWGWDPGSARRGPGVRAEASFPPLICRDRGDPWMRPDPPTPSRPFLQELKAPMFLAIGLVFGGLSAVTAVPAALPQAASPAFGDSDREAPPPPGALDGETTDPGPRVAERDHEPVGETVLRTPFRLLFLPLRLVARGLEGVAGVAGEQFVPTRTFGADQPPFTVTPVFAYDGAPGPAVGLKATNHFNREHNGYWSVAGTYSLWDMRRVYGSAHYGRPDERWGVHVNGDYRFRPNESHYGLGNYSVRDNKGIWLQELGRIDATVKYGTPKRQVRWFTG